MSSSEVSSVENILYSGSYIFEGGRTKNKPPCHLFRYEPTFEKIWTGGIVRGHHLALKLQVSEDEFGRLLYNGRPYNRDCWTWRPPKFIRQQGRLAKGSPDPRNSYPTERIATEDGSSIRIRARCRGIDEPCEGKLLYDERLFLYCNECGLIRDHFSFTQIPIHETSGAPMTDHDRSLELELEKKWTSLGLKYI